MEAAEFHNWADAYIEAQKRRVADADDPLWWAIDRFYELMETAPEICLQVLFEISRRDPPRDVLDAAGAGPLEDLIDRHGGRFIDQIEAEAKQNVAFQKMLSAVWESGDSDTWLRVTQAKSSKA